MLIKRTIEIIQKMNSDEVGHYYVELIYTALKDSPETVNKYYDQSATLTQKFCDEEEKTFKEKFNENLINGDHVIMRCDGIQLGDEITVHASGYVKKDEKFYQSNEMFVFKASSPEPLVLYQSSYFLPVQDPNWKPVEIVKPPPKPEPKEEKKEPAPPPDPVEVKSPAELMYNRTILCQGLPFKCEPSLIIKDRLMRHGIVTKYCKGKGQILVEYENPASLTRMLEQGEFQWKGKKIRVKGMPQGYTFTV